MKRITMPLAVALFLSVAQAEQKFFALDNGLNGISQPEEQAKLLKELGYDGICTRPGRTTPEFLAAFDKHGIEIMATYVVLSTSPDKSEVPQSIKEHFKTLKGRNTIIWFGVQNKKATEEEAVALTRNVCDAAAENGLSVVFYPHVGFYSDTVAASEKLRKVAGRDNLGVSLCLCHFLAQNDHATLEPTIKSVAGSLKLVKISGANELPAPKADWDQLIQPLGKGTFDMNRVFKALDEIGYKGDFGLQCFKIPGPPKEHLSASIAAWKKYRSK